MTRTFIRWIGAGLLVATVLAAPMLTSCSRTEEPLVRKELIDRCVVLASKNKERDASGWVRWLDQHLAGAVWFEGAQIDEAIRTCTASDKLLVIPGTFAASAEAEVVIGDYLLAGGRMLNLGTRHIFATNSSVDIQTAVGFGQPHLSVTASVVRVHGVDGVLELSPRTMIGTIPGPLGTGGIEPEKTDGFP